MPRREAFFRYQFSRVRDALQSKHRFDGDRPTTGTPQSGHGRASNSHDAGVRPARATASRHAREHVRLRVPFGNNSAVKAAPHPGAGQTAWTRSGPRRSRRHWRHIAWPSGRVPLPRQIRRPQVPAQGRSGLLGILHLQECERPTPGDVGLSSHRDQRRASIFNCLLSVTSYRHGQGRYAR